MRPIPPLRLCVVPPISGAGRGLVVGLPLTAADLTHRAGVARRKVTRALEGARRTGLTVVALGGLLAQPWWSALIAREGRVRTVTGEGLAIIAVADALGALAGARLPDWRVGVVVGPAGRLAAETLAVWLARIVGQVALFGPRPALEGIADRILGDSGLVAEVNVAPPGPRSREIDGSRPVDALCLFGPLPAGSEGAVGDETVVIDMDPGAGMVAPTLRPGWRIHRVRVGLPWPGRAAPRAARLFPAEGDPAGPGIRLLPPSLAEAILEAGAETGPTQPSIRRVERLAAIARRRKTVAGRLCAAEPGRQPGSG